MDYWGALSSREIAVAIWAGAIFLWVLRRAEFRRALAGVAGSLLKWKVSAAFAAIGLYIGCVAALLHKLGLWDTSLTKDTLFWVFGVAIPLTFQLGRSAQRGYYTSPVVDALKLTAIVGFVVGKYTFGLWLELLIAPLLALLAGVSAFAQESHEHGSAKAVCDGALALAGLTMVVYALWCMVANLADFATFSTLRELALPATLTAAFIPFLYLLGLVGAYDSALCRISFVLDGRPELVRLAVRGMLARVQAFGRHMARQLTKQSDRSDVEQAIREFSPHGPDRDFP